MLVLLVGLLVAPAVSLVASRRRADSAFLPSLAPALQPRLHFTKRLPLRPPTPPLLLLPAADGDGDGNSTQAATDAKVAVATADGDSGTQKKRRAGRPRKRSDDDDKKMVEGVAKGIAMVDRYFSEKDSYHVYQNEDELWDANLNLAKLGSNNNKYYIIQLLEHDTNPNDYVCWNRWGRVGYSGNSHCDHFQDIGAAKSAFRRKFRDKTKNAWKGSGAETVKDFQPATDRYTLIEMDYSSSTEEEEQKISKRLRDPSYKPKPAKDPHKAKSKLHAKVLALVERISDMKMMDDSMRLIGYDSKKLPLGKISKGMIQRAYEVLKQIDDALNQGGNREQLMDLSSQFYTIIPHDFGMRNLASYILDSPSKVREKLRMLEALADIEIATKLLKERSDVSEHPADAKYRSLRCDIRPLKSTEDMYKLIASYVSRTHGKTHSYWKLKTKNVYEIHREGEEQRFSKHKDNDNRLLLWHGSRLTNYVGILSQGLRIAPPEAPSTGYMFGKGVYFADMVSKSAQYCNVYSWGGHRRGNENIGLLLLAEVALGKMNELNSGDCSLSLKKLPEGKLSTKGMGRMFPDPAKTVTLPSGVRVPAANAIESTKSYRSLNYNEFIVYDVAQICLRYLVEVEFS
ncbi:unnamed protein product [Vitrella brassicaformis CCMP3155]|uniref:Poly [ADP-ribose] polymerase n=1 Tax=Vitrella brassicaformis (strain CCMP3155) TaxID=1169540 RepID=A0A0G4EL11_VITBC|nr:unnamed protein product [Vitrella brassicaformis CCMP3155]|eukprot:CEL98091.1 unnamed protein product [Vitrella brassicaformis CCMP3155]